MSDPLIVDGDGHTMEPDDLWTERMDHSKWGDWIPRKVIEDEYYETVYAGGTIRGGGRALKLLAQEFRHLPLELLRRGRPVVNAFGHTLIGQLEWETHFPIGVIRGPV